MLRISVVGFSERGSAEIPCVGNEEKLICKLGTSQVSRYQRPQASPKT